MGKRVKEVAAAVLSISILLTSCVPANTFNNAIERAAEPYKFDIVGWEFRTLSGDVKAAFSSDEIDFGDARTVVNYFDLNEQIDGIESDLNALKSSGKSDDAELLLVELEQLKQERQGLEKPVGLILEKQIESVLSDLGIYNGADVFLKTGITFPPVNFELTNPPALLVVSPRDKIESLKTVLLEASISVAEREKLESEVDQRGVSSLVVNLGGVATYPSFVSNDGDLRWVIDTACEEWLHQYLTFRPLGFRYFLSLEGIAHDSNIAALDETLASMTAKEIGEIIFDRFYRISTDLAPLEKGQTGFDYNGEMQNIRKNVDLLLAAGKVSEAELFMEEKRQYLATQGYNIRKLNQAYFAFHGSYTDSPTSVDPLGEQMRKLRKNSLSIKDFLDRASFITTREELNQIFIRPVR